MVEEPSPVSPLLRTCAWIAIVGMFGGILSVMVSSGKTGEPYWPLVLVLPASLPGIALLIPNGPDLLVRGSAGSFGSARRRPPATVVWTITLVLMAGMCFFAWSFWSQGRAREYWVFLMGEGSFREMNEIGRIETDVLDDLVPVRPPKRERAHDPDFR